MNCEKEVDNLCKWITEYVDGAGAEGVIIGLSGGIDSTVVADLCVRALGKKRVYALMMPPSVNADIIADKLELAYAPYHDFMYEAGTVANYFLYRSIEGASKTKEERDLIVGNVASRMRMVGLYAWANLKNYMVVGTTNKSEYEVSYFTKYGDGGVDFEPIADYYKTEVYELAEYLGVPQEIIDAVPSAGLWDDQTDEGEIGMGYKQLDSILKNHYNDNGYRNDINLVGSDKVGEMIKKGEHKKHMPPFYKREN